MSCLLLITALLSVAGAALPNDAIIAEVNGRYLTEADLAAFLALRGVTGEISGAARQRAIEHLVERELVRQFLERRRTEADAEQLTAALRGTRERLAARTSQQPDAVLESLGLDEARLRSTLAVSLAWHRHVRRAVTDRQIRDYFEQHRRRLDGTRLRVSQIFLPYSPGESLENAPATLARLRAIREEIASGRTTFADAAREHSQAPSAAAGGDLGWIGPRGDLPAAVTQAAYSVESGKMTDIVLTSFGAHLVLVAEVQSGELSLEDVRPTILAELSQDLWNDTVAAERGSANIVIKESTKTAR